MHTFVLHACDLRHQVMLLDAIDKTVMLEASGAIDPTLIDRCVEALSEDPAIPMATLVHPAGPEATGHACVRHRAWARTIQQHVTETRRKGQDSA